MTKIPHTQSQKRFSESIGARFLLPTDHTTQDSLLFLKSSSDEGVIRNGGRNGARFAPQSFLSVFKKLSLDDGSRGYTFHEVEVASSWEESEDFSLAQDKEAKRIDEALKAHPHSRICHLGGGHDHVYPLAMALSQSFTKVVIINLDAHADTRTDASPHSGTPFRQFSQNFPGEFHLFQVGLHPFANSESTLQKLEKGQMSILWRRELDNDEKYEAFFGAIHKVVDEKTLVIFSIDADALDGSIVPGVSAVNAYGLKREHLLRLWQDYRKLGFLHTPVMGIYELNPVFDTLSMMSMRTLASFVYESLE